MASVRGLADCVQDFGELFQPVPGDHFRHNPDHVWDAAKLGMSLQDAFTVLPKKFNLMAIPIISRDSFRQETKRAASLAQNQPEFVRLLSQRMDERRRQKVRKMKHVLRRIAEIPTLMDDGDSYSHWHLGLAQCLAHSKSFDSIVDFLGGYLRTKERPAAALPSKHTAGTPTAAVRDEATPGPSRYDDTTRSAADAVQDDDEEEETEVETEDEEDVDILNLKYAWFWGILHMQSQQEAAAGQGNPGLSFYPPYNQHSSFYPHSTIHTPVRRMRRKQKAVVGQDDDLMPPPPPRTSSSKGKQKAVVGQDDDLMPPPTPSSSWKGKQKAVAGQGDDLLPQSTPSFYAPFDVNSSFDQFGVGHTQDSQEVFDDDLEPPPSTPFYHPPGEDTLFERYIASTVKSDPDSFMTRVLQPESSPAYSRSQGQDVEVRAQDSSFPDIFAEVPHQGRSQTADKSPGASRPASPTTAEGSRKRKRSPESSPADLPEARRRKISHAPSAASPPDSRKRKRSPAPSPASIPDTDDGGGDDDNDEQAPSRKRVRFSGVGPWRPSPPRIPFVRPGPTPEEAQSPEFRSLFARAPRFPKPLGWIRSTQARRWTSPPPMARRASPDNGDQDLRSPAASFVEKETEDQDTEVDTEAETEIDEGETVGGEPGEVPAASADEISDDDDTRPNTPRSPEDGELYAGPPPLPADPSGDSGSDAESQTALLSQDPRDEGETVGGEPDEGLADEASGQDNHSRPTSPRPREDSEPEAIQPSVPATPPASADPPIETGRDTQKSPRAKASNRVQKSTSRPAARRAAKTTAQDSRARPTRSSARLTRRSGQTEGQTFHELDAHGKARAVVKLEEDS